MHRPRHGGPGEHLVGDIGIYEDDIDKPNVFCYVFIVSSFPISNDSDYNEIMIIVMMMLKYNLRKR